MNQVVREGSIIRQSAKVGCSLECTGMSDSWGFLEGTAHIEENRK